MVEKPEVFGAANDDRIGNPPPGSPRDDLALLLDRLEDTRLAAIGDAPHADSGQLVFPGPT